MRATSDYDSLHSLAGHLAKIEAKLGLPVAKPLPRADLRAASASLEARAKAIDEALDGGNRRVVVADPFDDDNGKVGGPKTGAHFTSKGMDPVEPAPAPDAPATLEPTSPTPTAEVKATPKVKRAKTPAKPKRQTIERVAPKQKRSGGKTR